MFLRNSLAFSMIINVGNLISGSSAISKSSFYILKCSVHILLKPTLKNFEHYLASMWNEDWNDNCEAVWTFFGTELLGDWNKNSPFPVLWPLLNFPNLLAHWVQHFNSIIFQDSKQLSWNSMTSTSFVHRNASWSPLDFTPQDVQLWVTSWMKPRPQHKSLLISL